MEYIDYNYVYARRFYAQKVWDNLGFMIDSEGLGDWEWDMLFEYFTIDYWI